MKDTRQLIETICLENGNYPLLEWHQRRLERAFAVHFPGELPHELASLLPRLEFVEKYKVRVVYDAEQTDVEFSQYQPRKLDHIKLVTHDRITYTHKYLDRKPLEKLFALRGAADEILIIKKGKLTDSFYANVALWDGHAWHTPDTYLLNGVRRQSLLATAKIRETSISVNDLASFEKISLINAMMDLGDAVLPVSAIE